MQLASLGQVSARTPTVPACTAGHRQQSGVRDLDPPSLVLCGLSKLPNLSPPVSWAAGYLPRLLTELSTGFEILTPSSSPSTPTSPKPPPPPPSTPTPFQLPLGSGKRPAHPGGQSQDAPSLTHTRCKVKGKRARGPHGVLVQAPTWRGPSLLSHQPPAAQPRWESRVGQGPVTSGDPAFPPEAPGSKDGVSGWVSRIPGSVSPRHTPIKGLSCFLEPPWAWRPFPGPHPSGEQLVPGEGCARFTPHRRPFPGGGGALEASGGCPNLSDSRASTPLQGGKPRPKRSRLLGQVFPEEVGLHPQAGEEECLWVREMRGSGRTGVGAVPRLPGGLHRPCPGSLWLLQPYWVPRARTFLLNGTQCPPTGVGHRVRARAQYQPDDLRRVTQLLWASISRSPERT